MTAPRAMTLKQSARRRFLRLVEQYRESKKNLGTPEGRAKFVRLSVLIHAAKGDVPKSFWPLVNRE